MTQTGIALRRESVKAMLLGGMNAKDIAQQLEVSEDTVRCDIQAVGSEAVMKRSEDVVGLAFKQFEEVVNWTVAEAEKMHVDGADLGALRFMVEKTKEKMDMAQSLGLLDRMAEKKDVTFNFNVDEKLAAEYGNWLATKCTTGEKVEE